MPYRDKAAIAVALAAALPGVIFALTDFRNGYVAIALSLLFPVALFFAWKFHRKSILCDAVLMIYFPQPALDAAGPVESSWLQLENRGTDDAFDIKIKTLKASEERRNVGFLDIPIARRGERTIVAPRLFKELGVLHPSLSVHPRFFAELLEEGKKIPGTSFNHETIIEIEFRDKDDRQYCTRNRIDFHTTQKLAAVFYLETLRRGDRDDFSDS